MVNLLPWLKPLLPTSSLARRRWLRKDVMSPPVPLYARRQSSWEPLACHLLIAGWLGLAHCARRLDVAACQTRRPAQPVDSQAVSATVLDHPLADCPAASASFWPGPGRTVYSLLVQSLSRPVVCLVGRASCPFAKLLETLKSVWMAPTPGNSTVNFC